MYGKLSALIQRFHWYGFLLLGASVLLTVPYRFVGGNKMLMLAAGALLLLAATWLALRWRDLPAPNLVDGPEPVNWKILGAIIGFGVLLRVIWLLIVPPIQTSDFEVYWNLAKGVLQRGDFSGTLLGVGTWYARRPPLLSYVLAGGMSVFGEWRYLPALLNLVLYIGSSLLIFSLARKTAGRAAAWVAIVLYAIWPSFIGYTGLAATEQLYTLCMLLAIWGLSHVERHGLIAWVFIGLVTGAGVLARQTLMIMPAVWILYVILRRMPPKRAIVGVLAGFIAMTVALTPWVVRNYRILGKPVITTIGGAAFFLGSNPHAGMDYTEEGLREVYVATGGDELRADAECYRLGREWIRNNPGTFIRISFEKQIIMLGEDTMGFYNSLRIPYNYTGRLYPVLQGLAHLWWVLIWVLAWIGVLRSREWFQKDALVAVMLWISLIFWLTLIPFAATPRYHVPFTHLILIFSGLGALHVQKMWLHFRGRTT
jgi:4-amino-4-deoxy-L-arabinose transferase-like glycosyltransferase